MRTCKPDQDFLLFCTGWDKRWGRADYYEAFPCLTQEAAAFVAELPLKGIGEAAYLALTAAYDGTWAENYGNQCVTMGAAQGAVGLPVDTWSLENWSVEEYEDMFQKIVSGEIAIDNDFSNLASTEHVALNIVE